MFFWYRKWIAAVLALAATTPALAHDLPQYKEPQTEAAGQLMLFEQEDIASSMHAIKHELEYLTRELEQERRNWSKSEAKELLDRAREMISSVDSEVNALWERFSQLNRRRWKTKTSLVHRDLFNARDIAAFDDRVSKLKSDRTEIYSLRDQLNRILEESKDEGGLVRLWLKKLFPTSNTGGDEDRAGTPIQPALIQITDDTLPKHEDERVATGSDVNHIEPLRVPSTILPSVMPFESEPAAETAPAGAIQPDAAATPAPASPTSSASEAEASRPLSETCGRYSGPYCGKSISEILDMKRLEEDF